MADRTKPSLKGCFFDEVRKAGMLAQATCNTFLAQFKFSSVSQSCLTLCDPMDCSTPGLPVHHQLPELAQTHVHWVSDAIQPSRPLLSSSPPAFNLAQHQGQMSQFFTSGGQSIGVSASASVLPMNIQDWFPLGWTCWISFLAPTVQIFPSSAVPQPLIIISQVTYRVP